MHDIIKMCSFESAKSTKGASKMRRDLLNAEISQLRDLLPLPASTRQRLSQLQLMALVCVYVRKSNYFQQAMKNHAFALNDSPNLEFLKALSGFLMMLTQGGKLLYISDNAAEYLGHSMEDLLIHGDSVFDIIDKQDHAAVQSELVRGAQSSAPSDDDRLFLCRMNVSRNARRQMRFGDQKVVLVQGHYLSYLPLCSRNEPVFLAQCTPVAMPETRECVVQGATNVFTSIHTLDMKFINIDRNGEYYLGYAPSYLAGASWYHLIHPDNLREAQTKHRLITSSEQDRSCILLLRLQTVNGSWRWVHCVLQVKDSPEATSTPPPTTATPPAPQASPTQNQQPSPSLTTTTPAAATSPTQQPVIVATNQVLGDKEAAVLRANSWLYHYYAMQSKLQYGITYDAHAQRVHAYYPQVMPYQADTSTPYMATPSLATAGHYHQSYTPHPGATPAYTLGAGNPYLQHYTHPYSMRLHHGFDYSRDPTWGYYDTQSIPGAETATHQPAHQSQQQPPIVSTPSATQPSQESPQQHQRVGKRNSSSPTSSRRSPASSTSSIHATSESSVGLATPVALRATVTTHHKGLSPETDDSDASSWKASPTQEVPEYPDHSPYVTPPYPTATSTKVSLFTFEADSRDPHRFHDQHVPSGLDPRESPWYAHAFVR